MPFKVERMRIEDVPEVLAVDRRCFSTPWPESTYRREVNNPDKNLYVVLRRVGEGPLTNPDPRTGFLSNILPFRKDGASPTPNPVVGYAGLWVVADEAHITTIAVLPELRGRKLGELLLETLLEHAIGAGASWVTLEARVSNQVAQALYRKYTFKNAGYRKRYYSDNGEDAVVMWSDRIDTPEFAEKLAGLKARLYESLNGDLMGVCV